MQMTCHPEIRRISGVLTFRRAQALLGFNDRAQILRSMEDCTLAMRMAQPLW